jgi:hypothetical protein
MKWVWLAWERRVLVGKPEGESTKVQMEDVI